MPCYTTTKVSISDKIERLNVDRLVEVLKADGWSIATGFATKLSVEIIFRDGTLKANGRDRAMVQEALNRVKRLYATETVKAGMKRFGWRVAETQAGDKIQLKARR